MKMTFIKMLIARIQSKSPAFYQKLRLFAIVGTIICGAILTAAQYNLFPIPANILQLAHDFGAGFTAVFGVSYVGTTDPDLINQDKPNE